MRKRTFLYCLLTFILGLVLGLLCDIIRHPTDKSLARTDTIIIEKTIEKPDPVSETPNGFVYGKLPKAPINSQTEQYIPLNPRIEDASNHIADTGKMVCDSVEVIIPITQKEYCDSDYRAWVSGYNASLDSIRVYSRTITHTKVKQPRLGLGVGVGASIGRRIEPCIFVGLTYTIKTF